MRPSDNIAEKKDSDMDILPRYVIDTEVFEAEGRSIASMVLERRCPKCWATLYQDAKAAQAISLRVHLKKILECCSTHVEYVTQEMPFLEVAFRRLLAAGPEGLPLDKLYELVVKERSITTLVPTLSIEALQRMLTNASYYGIRDVARPIEESS